VKKHVLSGMRPTGSLHLGHLVGALNNWIELQEKYESFFMVADWHALMSEYTDPSGIQQNIFDNVVDWISCGIDPNKSTIFIQSDVKEHLELHIILSCLTPLSWLERCPTYKEQLNQMQSRDLTTYGFLGYPVLQAADILIYKATYVPVGEDQLPHLELSREIAKRFNHLYKKIFLEPKPILTKNPRLLGIDGRKMSKSYENTIALSDSKNEIRQKVGRMFTDPKRIRLCDPGHPKECNVYSYYEVFKPQEAKELLNDCPDARLGCTECKKKLAQILIEFLSKIQEKRDELIKNKNYIREILKDGSRRAQEVASQTIDEVRKAISLGI
jgi:tryptophanyl-tRNA synthetase